MDENSQPRELEDFPIGALVGNRYEVLGYLGHGGMGFVLKARDIILDNETVVLKILYPRFGQDVAIFARFRREVLLTRKLSHPNIVRIYDFGQALGDTYFISMEYVEGENLRSKLKSVGDQSKEGKGLVFAEVVHSLHQIALGLGYAHSQGVMHRDVKPANMLINAKGEVKITDFGVARSIESTEKLTQTDETVGSPVYMSPEQLDTANMDHRSDIYSLGIMAYELAMGRPPFFSNHFFMLIKMHMSDPIPSFAGKESGIPYWFQELVNRACEKDPAKRFQSAYDFAKFIAKHANVGELGAVGAASSNAESARSQAGLTAFISPVIAISALALLAAVFWISSLILK